MRILLDTSYLYDFMDSPGRLLPAERQLLSRSETAIHVGAVSLWEIRLTHNARYAPGVRKSRFSPSDVLAALDDQDVTYVPMTVRHAVQSLETPIPRKDPFDVLLLVQAQEENLMLLTADRLLIGHPLAVTVREMA